MTTSESEMRAGHNLDDEFDDDVECEYCGGDCTIPGPFGEPGPLVERQSFLDHAVTVFEQPCPSCGTTEAGRTLFGERIVSCYGCGWKHADYVEWAYGDRHENGG